MRAIRVLIPAVGCAALISAGVLYAQTDWSRSPFRSSRAASNTGGGKAAVQPKTLALRATMVEAGGKESAIIGNQIIAVGDTVAGFTVRAIRPGQVVLRQDQRTVTLSVWK